LEREASEQGWKIAVSECSPDFNPGAFLDGFPLQKWALKKIDRVRRSFLWKGAADANGGHCLVRWAKTNRPKKFGGLGILDLELFSRALRLRWLWLEWTEQDRP